MKKKLSLFLILLSLFTMLPYISFADENKPGLNDVIEILQVLAGGYQPPAFNATGTWAVQSSPEGVTRTGEVFLDMTPEGKITGYAELTSLPGLSSVNGQVHGLSFDLEMMSKYGTIVVHGVASSDGQNINGNFFFKENVNINILWNGYRQTTTTSNGTYDYDPLENKLILTYDGVNHPYNVTDFTETSVKLSYQIWERNIPGEIDSFIGVWRNNAASTETIMTFKENGQFSIIQILNK
jgi:threonine dehydrogenase-like Zn-dependent dehydrogenase